MTEPETDHIENNLGLPKCDNCGYEFDQDLLGKYGCPNCENDRDHDIGDDPNYQ